MLREIHKVQQHKEEPFRRWFTDNYFDLIVWYSNKEIIGFQLCYDKTQKERALTWKKDSGFQHNLVDDGCNTPLKNQTPILIPDGMLSQNEILKKFKDSSKSINKEIAGFISEKIKEAL